MAAWLSLWFPAAAGCRAQAMANTRGRGRTAVGRGPVPPLPLKAGAGVPCRLTQEIEVDPMRLASTASILQLCCAMPLIAAPLAPEWGNLGGQWRFQTDPHEVGER